MPSTTFPGAPGIGEKGARDLIERFGPLRTCSRAPPRWSARCTAKACKTTPNADPYEQEPGHARLRRPGRCLARSSCARTTPILTPCQVYKELEFSASSRDMGRRRRHPHARITARSPSPKPLRRCRRDARRAPLAVAVQDPARAVPLGVIGLAGAAGEARSLPCTCRTHTPAARRSQPPQDRAAT